MIYDNRKSDENEQIETARILTLLPSTEEFGCIPSPQYLFADPEIQVVIVYFSICPQIFDH